MVFAHGVPHEHGVEGCYLVYTHARHPDVVYKSQIPFVKQINIQLKSSGISGNLYSMDNNSRMKEMIIFNLCVVIVNYRDEDPEFFSTDPDPAQLKKNSGSGSGSDSDLYFDPR
mgnify:FL=1